MLRRVILPAGDHIFGQNMMRRLALLESAQWWSPDRLEEARNQRLRELIHTAYYETPFYRDLMTRAGTRPEDIRTCADLSRLPVVSKAMLREAYPDRIVRRTPYRSYEGCSSGSTGANIRVREDTETAGFYRASLLLALQWAGWRVGEPHVQSGVTPRTADRAIKDWVLRCHYVTAHDLRDEQLDRVLDHLERHRIRHLWGYPGSLYYLALRARQRGWNVPLRSIVTWGDNLYDHYRRAIESTFRRQVFDTYGCGEGFHIAAQCGVEENYHVHSLDVVAEILDDRGAPVPVGQSGDVTITRLHAGPTPIIRYQVGDRAVRGPREKCPCGRGFERMARIEGRDTDVVVTPSGNRLIVHFFTGIIEHFSEVEMFQVLQQDVRSIVLRVVASQSGRNSDEWQAELISRLRESGARDLDIQLSMEDEIPTAPSGKRRFVIGRKDLLASQ